MRQGLTRRLISSSLFLLAVLPGVAAAQSQGVTLDDAWADCTELPDYKVMQLDYLSEENIIATVFDVRSGFVPGDPRESAVAVGGSFGPFITVGGFDYSFNQAVTYGGDGSLVDIGATVISEAHGVNSKQTVVGFATGAPVGSYKAFRYDQGVWTLLPGLGASTSNAMAVNDSGIIVGYDSSGWGHSTAVYWTPDKQVHPLLPDASSSELYAINNRNVAVGYVAFGVNGQHQACSLELGGSKQLTLLPAPFAVNEGAWAQSINDRGVIVGIASKGGAYQPVMWKAGQAFALPVLPNEGSGGARANDINHKGVIVGNSNWGKAVVWIGGQIHDLNELVPSSPFFLTNAVAINDEGVIACHADNGVRTAVLLIPQG